MNDVYLTNLRMDGPNTGTVRLDYATETAVEHLLNARQVALLLVADFKERGMTETARTVLAIDERLRFALVQIGKGNIGREK